MTGKLPLVALGKELLRFKLGYDVDFLGVRANFKENSLKESLPMKK